MGEFDPGLGFDLIGYAGDDAVEQVDMLIGVIVGARQKQVGDPAKNFGLFVGRSGCETAFNLGDDRSLFHHSIRPFRNVGTCHF
jgi:hypothetical protein